MKTNTHKYRNINKYFIKEPINVKIQNDENLTKKALKYIIDKVIIVVLVSIITLISGNLVINKIFIKQSDSINSYSSGSFNNNEIEWVFKLHPERETIFDKKNLLLIAQAHIEVSLNQIINSNIDFSQFKKLNFYAKCSFENFQINQFNIFNKDKRGEINQFIYNKPIIINSNYSKFTIDLNENSFSVPDIIVKNNLQYPPIDFSNIFAFGFDITTIESVVEGTIWISKISLIDNNDNEIDIDFCNKPLFTYKDISLVWSFRKIVVSL